MRRVLVLLLGASAAEAKDAPATLPLMVANTPGGTSYSVPIQTLLFFTALSFLPAVLLLMTGFTRIVIVLSLLRQALGTQSAPPNQVILGLSLFLTGSGLNVTCINMMLTQRFAPDAHRRESAFLWNYAGMNVGFFIGFTVAGHYQLDELYGHIFWFATLGNAMAIVLALLAREVDVAVLPMSAGLLQHFKAGRLRALGFTSARRTADQPDIPVIAEGIPGFEAGSWQGFFVPAKTPRPIIDLPRLDWLTAVVRIDDVARVVDLMKVAQP